KRLGAYGAVFGGTFAPFRSCRRFGHTPTQGGVAVPPPSASTLPPEASRKGAGCSRNAGGLRPEAQRRARGGRLSESRRGRAVADPARPRSRTRRGALPPPTLPPPRHARGSRPAVRRVPRDHRASLGRP